MQVKTPTVLLVADAEKAFDRLERNFMYSVLG